MGSFKVLLLLSLIACGISQNETTSQVGDLCVMADVCSLHISHLDIEELTVPREFVEHAKTQRGVMEQMVTTNQVTVPELQTVSSAANFLSARTDLDSADMNQSA